MLTQRGFLTFSELQVRIDGVNATQCYRDALDAAARAPTRVVRESTCAGIIDRSFGFMTAVSEATRAIEAARTEAESLSLIHI